MQKFRSHILIFLLVAWSVLTHGQSLPFVTKVDQLKDTDFADWIAMPDADGKAYAVYLFRKTFTLENPIRKFIIHVSADNRYILYVNGKRITYGPAVGDLANWHYETIDISPYLSQGANTIAAKVWNYGEFKGSRQISDRTAFILQGAGDPEKRANTNESWKVFQDTSYHPIKFEKDPATSFSHEIGGGYIAGATDYFNGNHHPWGWSLGDFDNSTWETPCKLGKGIHFDLNTWHQTNKWRLVPRQIPLMEEKTEQLNNLVKMEGISMPFVESLTNVKIPKNKTVKFLIDNEVLTMGFPHLMISGGKNAKITIRYQEALFDSNNNKGNRNNLLNKSMKGYYDVFISDGGTERILSPLWLRVFRFAEVEVKTEDNPLQILNFVNHFTAYPFKLDAFFESDKKLLDTIWDVSWRTARLCALETYMDCPYYEQLQYIGDTRIQALISFYLCNDPRLAKNALKQFANSIQPNGLTMSSYPNNQGQIIPPFSLIYICMLHDYFMMYEDDNFITSLLPGVNFILEWFISKIDESGQLGKLEFWNHVDGGTSEFAFGVPPGAEEGHSANLGLLLSYSMEKAAEMMDYLIPELSGRDYLKISEQLKRSIYENCWDDEKQLLAETPNKELFSQHTNSFAILTDILSPETSIEVARKIFTDESLAKTSLYFDFYLFQALKKAGLGGEIIPLMSKWKYFIDNGLTTFPEHGLESRSDCHAWSAHPIYDFLNITCGISPASPAFKTVEIRPQLGELNHINASMPHQYGAIELKLEKTGNEKLIGRINLPEKLSGTLIYKKRSYKLNEGINMISIYD